MCKLIIKNYSCKFNVLGIWLNEWQKVTRVTLHRHATSESERGRGLACWPSAVPQRLPSTWASRGSRSPCPPRRAFPAAPGQLPQGHTPPRKLAQPRVLPGTQEALVPLRLHTFTSARAADVRPYAPGLRGRGRRSGALPPGARPAGGRASCSCRAAPGHRPKELRFRSPPPRSLGPSPPLPGQPPRSWRSRPSLARFPATTPAHSPSPALEAVLASHHVPFPLRRTRTFQSPGNHRYCRLCNISFSSRSAVIAHENYYWSSQVRSTWSELGTIGWSGTRFTRPTSLSSSRTGLLVGLQRWDNPQGPGCWGFLLPEPHQTQAIVEGSAWTLGT